MKSKTPIIVAYAVTAISIAYTATWYFLRSFSALETVQPDYSENRSIKELGGDITINFGQCTPDQRRVDFEFGSTLFVISGARDDKTCLFKYLIDIEDPKGSGGTVVACAVPRTLGLVTFRQTPDGTDWRLIQQYCKTN